MKKSIFPVMSYGMLGGGVEYFLMYLFGVI